MTTPAGPSDSPASIEQELRESEERFRMLAEAAQEGIVIHEHGAILDVNDAVARMYGYTRSEMIGMNVLDTAAPEVVERIKAHMATGSAEPYETIGVRKDGTRFIAEVVGRQMPYHGRIVRVVSLFDVTVRKEAEQALRRSEEKFRRVVETSVTGIYIIQDEKLAYVNPAFAAIFGYPQEEIVGMGVTDLIAPEDRLLVAGRARQRLGGLVETRVTVIHGVRRDGALIDVEVLGVLSEFGGRPAILGTLVDVTKRREAEAALRKSEEKFRQLVETSLTGIFIIQDDTLAYVNPSLARIFGYVPEDIIGKMGPELIAMESRQRADRAIRERIAGTIVGEHEIYTAVKKDGEKIFIEVHGMPSEYQGRPAVMGTLVDVTRRLQAEAQALANAKRLDAMFDQSTAGMAMVGMDGQWLRVNRRLCEILGYTEKALQRVRFQDITHPDDLEESLAAFRAFRDGTISRYFKEKRYLRGDGGVAWVHLSAGVVRDDAGRPEYFVAILDDIAERRKLEAMFVQAQKMESVGRLAGGVAHDFNNLLTVIGGYTELLSAELRPEDSGWVKTEAIRRAVDQASALTRQLLAFSRHQVLEQRVMDLNESIQGMQAILTRLIGEDIAFTARLADGLWPVLADAAQFTQIVMNLAVNARDAMPRGGRLVVETSNVEVPGPGEGLPPTIVAGDYVRLSVEDSGTGMDVETLARIFEPFFTTKGQGKGTGLGLSMVYGIVNQSGGFIWVGSDIGKGTRFSIYLPRVKGTAAATISRNVPITQTRGHETILVVDDQEELRELTAEILRPRGYNILMAASGEAARDLVAGTTEPIDLVLTDTVMTGMTGLELGVLIESLRPRTRMLYMSGYLEHGNEAMNSLGRDRAFIQKPFTPTSLAKKIREVLDAR